MSENPQTAMKCHACGHQWQETLPEDVVADAWIAYTCSLRCPACGAGPKYVTLDD